MNIGTKAQKFSFQVKRIPLTLSAVPLALPPDIVPGLPEGSPEDFGGVMAQEAEKVRQSTSQTAGKLFHGRSFNRSEIAGLQARERWLGVG